MEEAGDIMGHINFNVVQHLNFLIRGLIFGQHQVKYLGQFGTGKPRLCHVTHLHQHEARSNSKPTILTVSVYISYPWHDIC